MCKKNQADLFRKYRKVRFLFIYKNIEGKTKTLNTEN